jgi:hypothetical protein
MLTPEDIAAGWRERLGDEWPDCRPSDLVTIRRADGSESQTNAGAFWWDGGPMRIVAYRVVRRGPPLDAPLPAPTEPGK